MAVHVAFEPGRTLRPGSGWRVVGRTVGGRPRPESHRHRVVRGRLVANRGQGEQDLPRAWQDRSGEVRWRGAVRRDEECPLTEAAGAAELLRIENADFELGTFCARPGIAETDVDALHVRRHREIAQHIGAAVGARQRPFQHDLGHALTARRGVLLPRVSRRGEKNESGNTRGRCSTHVPPQHRQNVQEVPGMLARRWN